MRIKFILLLTILTTGCSENNWDVIFVEDNNTSQARYVRDLYKIEAAIQRLNPIIGAYPPIITSDQHRQEIYDSWWETTRLAQEIDVVFPNDPEVLLRLGELSQMGHNLDINGSAQRSEVALSRAIELDPKNVRALLSLSRLYINSGVKQKKAEQLLFEAKRLSLPTALPEADSGLMFIYLQLDRKEDAIKYGEQYLEANPSDIRIRKLVDGSRANEVKNQWVPLQKP